ncbi:hypothetical protein JL721_3515 [Aureococcus anophagefferens]|nr:hypothetical protein JL721_3515 [Aureococcus anophagefferens]
MICETDEKMKDGAGGTGPGSGNPPSGGPGTGSGNGPPPGSSGSSGSSGSAGAGRRLGKVDDCWGTCEAWLAADEALAGGARRRALRAVERGAGADVEDEPKDPDDYATNNAISLHPTLP